MSGVTCQVSHVTFFFNLNLATYIPSFLLEYCIKNVVCANVFNRPGVAGAVLKTPLPFINWFINSISD